MNGPLNVEYFDVEIIKLSSDSMYDANAQNVCGNIFDEK